MAPSPVTPHIHSLNPSCSKSSSSKTENKMYAPLSSALNYGLEELSEVEVDGLPKFQNHIVFVPLDEGVTSDRDLEGLSFKPDVVLMSFTTACDFRKIKYTRTLKVSQFVSKIPKNSRMGPPEAIPSEKVSKRAPSKKAPKKAQPKTVTNKVSSKKTPPQNNPPRAPPSDHIGWKDILSAVELKRGRKKQWPTLGNFTNTVPAIANEGSDEALLEPRKLDPGISSDISTSQTCKIHTLIDECTADESCSCNFKTQRKQAVCDR